LHSIHKYDVQHQQKSLLSVKQRAVNTKAEVSGLLDSAERCFIHNSVARISHMTLEPCEAKR